MQDLNTKKVSIKIFIIRRIRTLKHQKSDFSFSSLQLQVVENMKLRNLKYEVLLKTCFIVFAVCQVYSASDMDLMLSDGVQCKTA